MGGGGHKSENHISKGDNTFIPLVPTAWLLMFTVVLACIILLRKRELTALLFIISTTCKYILILLNVPVVLHLTKGTLNTAYGVVNQPCQNLLKNKVKVKYFHKKQLYYFSIPSKL